MKGPMYIIYNGANDVNALSEWAPETAGRMVLGQNGGGGPTAIALLCLHRAREWPAPTIAHQHGAAHYPCVDACMRAWHICVRAPGEDVVWCEPCPAPLPCASVRAALLQYVRQQCAQLGNIKLPTNPRGDAPSTFSLLDQANLGSSPAYKYLAVVSLSALEHGGYLAPLGGLGSGDGLRTVNLPSTKSGTYISATQVRVDEERLTGGLHQPCDAMRYSHVGTNQRMHHALQPPVGLFLPGPFSQGIWPCEYVGKIIRKV